MAYVLVLKVPVKPRLELCPIVGLYDENSEGQPANDFINELNGRLLIAGIEYLQDPYPCTIVHSRELIEPLPRTWYSLQELYIYLQPMTRLAFLVSLPALLVGSMLLACGQST